jgi:TonB-linked SusC/RagA family outer membrane protein
MQLTKMLQAKVFRYLILLLITQQGIALHAQNPRPSVIGIVRTEEGGPLSDAVVKVENSETHFSATVTSNEKGIFSFPSLPNGSGYSFIFSHVGYATDTLQGYTVKDNTSISLSQVMKTRNEELGQVVVTALGIVQKKAALGYATQEVKGTALNEARDNNFVNSLSGRVAGLNIISGSGVGSSARITIRGESSLNYQKNQPLIIVDGVPVGNDPVQNAGGTVPDYGSSIGEFNPADIESVNVLKGAAASSLYGSRAANGVIVITTKSGRGRKGIGVSYTGGYTWEKPLLLPKYQNSFGGGQDGTFVGSNFGYSNNGKYPDGVHEDWDESWGPRLDGRPITQFDSPTDNGFRGGDVYEPNRGNIIATPWVAAPNNMQDFFVTGHSRFNSVALSGSNDVSNFRFSYTNNAETGIVPNNNLARNSFNLKAGYKLSSRLTGDALINYTKTNSSSRPDLGYGQGTPMYEFVWMNRNVNINSLRRYWQPGLEGVQQFTHDYANGHDNPFFYAYENPSGQNKDQMYGNIKLNYKILENLTIMGRVGTDYFNDFRPRKMAYSTFNATKGFYQETVFKYQENNYDFLINYKNQVGGFHYDVSVGGNTMERSRSNRVTTANQLLLPNVYSLNNSSVALQGSSYDERRKTNSLYAFFQLDYQQKIFVNVTGRNDWSSTLPTQHNSYFYPSVNTSILVNRWIKMSPAIDLFKIRLAYAQAGNDADPYQIITAYNYQALWAGIPSLSESGQLNNLNLKPEKSSTLEAGAELNLYKNRIGLDVTVYKTSSRNQILPLQTPISSGYGARIINAGEISNKGIEVQLNAVPVRLSNSLEWTVSLNFARNISKVISLYPGVEKIVQAAPGEDATIDARVGERMGALYGPGFQRVPSGPLKGMILIGSNGRPQITSDAIYLGNINPDWTMGINNRVSFKGAYLEFLFDISHGGVIISRFINKATGAGQLIETEGVRLTRKEGQVYDATYYRDGAVLMLDGSYQRNLEIFDGTYSKGLNGTGPRDFYKRYYDHNSEAQLIDRSFVKLRELKLGYNFPAKMYKRLPVQNISLSFVGRNLALWTKNQHFDPETGASTGGGLVGGFENLSRPTTRSLGFNLNVNF